jgi:hypothetical protein
VARRQRRAKSATKRTTRKSAKTTPRSSRRAPLLRRVVEAPARRRSAKGAAPPVSPFAGLPTATLDRSAGDVEMEISFGHAQHGKYTIQLFDPSGTQELAVEQGVSTDSQPDRFTLRMSPSALNGHLLQWSGAVDAFSNQPAQRFSVLFEVMQRGQVVPDGSVEKEGPLNVTQAFLGALVLVTP